MVVPPRPGVGANVVVLNALLTRLVLASRLSRSGTDEDDDDRGHRNAASDVDLALQ